MVIIEKENGPAEIGPPTISASAKKKYRTFKPDTAGAEPVEKRSRREARADRIARIGHGDINESGGQEQMTSEPPGLRITEIDAEVGKADTFPDPTIDVRRLAYVSRRPQESSERKPIVSSSKYAFDNRGKQDSVSTTSDQNGTPPATSAKTSKLPSGQTGSDLDVEQNEIQLVCFSLDSQEYGLHICRVQEISRYAGIMQIPDSSPYVKGAINLRKRIIPVMDLRSRLGCSPKKPDRHTRIIVLDHQGELFGMVVDSVTQVIRIDRAQIVKPPEIVPDPGRDLLEGIYRQDESTILILDSARTLEV